MKSLIELDQLTLDAANKSQLIAWVRALLSQTSETTARLQAKTAEIKRKDFKIEALTFELARLRRIQFGAKNEALSPLQRDIFAETLAADIAAIEVDGLNNLPMLSLVPLSPNPNALVPTEKCSCIFCQSLRLQPKTLGISESLRQQRSLTDRNNPVENCIRPIALGKKNGLFVGSERAGRRAAAIQTLFGTAKLNGLNPAEWLKDTLENLPT